MKIGLFGCSFTDIKSNHGFPKYNSWGRPWGQILSEDYNHNVTCYGRSASSVYFSYLKFKDTYENFDKNIFLGTYPDRKLTNNFGSIKEFSVAYIDNWPPTLSERQREIIKNYYAYIHNEQEAEDMKTLMVNDIKRLGGDNLLYIDVPTTIANITIKENSVFNHYPKSRTDHRWCHMSNENNLIFAEKINNWLNGNSFVFNINDYKMPTVEELKSYYDIT